MENAEDPFGRVAPARTRRGASHRPQLVGPQRVDGLDQRLRGELAVADPHRRPGLDHRVRVGLLVGAPEPAGDQDHGQPDRGDLGDRADAGAAHHQVGPGHQGGHVVGEG